MKELGRYRLVVKLLKLILYSIIFFTFIYIYMTSSNKINNIHANEDSFFYEEDEKLKLKDSTIKENSNLDKIEKTEIDIEKTIFQGFSSDQNPFSIVVNKAKKIKDGPFEIENIHSSFDSKFGKIEAFSKLGQFCQKDNNLYLKNNVQVILKDFTFNADNLKIDVKSKKIYDCNNIFLDNKNLKIKANKMETNESYEKFNLKGSVTTIIDFE